MSDGRIFISYRRGAENGDARALHVELEKHIDRSRIFMDVDSIPPGVDFHEFLERQVAECEVLLAVIGPGWHSQIARLQDPDDVVRIEIAAALRRPGLRVVPVLIDDAAMPRTEDLPESLRPLTRRQNVTLRHEDRYSDTVAWFARQLSPSGQGPSPPLDPEEPHQNAKRGDVTRRAAIWGSVAAIAGLGYVVANRDDLSGRPSRTAGPPSPEVVASAPADAVAPPPPEPEWLASGFGRETVRLEGHSGWVGSIAFSPDRHGLVSGGADGTIRRWDTVTGLQTAELQGHRRAVYSVAFAPDGRSLASGSDDSTVRLWDAGTGQEIAQLRGHQAAVNSVAFAPDGGLLASGGDDSTIRLWDAKTGRETAKLESHRNWVRSVAFASGGQRLGSGSDDRTVQLSDPATGRQTALLQGHTGGVISVALAPDGRGVASGSGDWTIRLWNPATGQETAKLRGHRATVRSIAFSPDGHRLASGSSDGTVRLWDPANGRQIAETDPGVGVVWSIAFAPDGRSLAAAGQDSTIRILELTG